MRVAIVSLLLFPALFGNLANAQVCEICGEGMIATKLDGSVSIPSLGDLTCASLVSAGENGQIGVADGSCGAVQGLVKDICGCMNPCDYRCNICGVNRDVTNSNGVVGPGRTCGDLLVDAQAGSDTCGGISPQECSDLEDVVENVCDCRAPTPAPTRTPQPTDTPTPRPTFGPPPDCYTDLDELFERDHAVEDTSVVRTYILCENTEFIMGRNNENGPGFVGGFGPLSPRKNAIYKCGQSGSSDNNCVLIDGTFQLVSFGFSFDEEQSNVVYQGITFESGFQGGLLMANPGDVTFKDCIIRNHQNIGPVILLFDSRFVRRLKETSSGDHGKDIRRVQEMIATGEYEEHARRLREEEEQSGRALQEANPDVLVDLIVTWQGCLFEANKGVPLDGQVVRPGIITTQFVEDKLIFDNCRFVENDYGRISVQPTGWAVSTEAPLTIKNTCFIDNNFRREAPVMVFDGHPVEASNNYGTQDDDVACQFLIEFPNDASLEALQNYTCIEYDSPTCKAIDPTPAPNPAPTVPPIQPTPPSTPDGGATTVVSILWITLASFAVCASMM